MFYFLRFPGFKYKAVTLSYDDGVVFDRKLIEIMDKYGLKGTFNINSGLFGASSTRLKKEEALELFGSSKHEVAVHGERHLHLSHLDEAVIASEIINDRINLERMFGKIIKGMAYSYGAFNDKVVEVLKRCGINYARTTVPTGRFELPVDWLRLNPTCHHKDPKLMEYVKQFIGMEDKYRNPPKLFYLWGHSYEFNKDENWHIIEQFAEKIANRDDIWYATNGEIYEYVKASENLVFSADGSIISNPTTVDIYLFFDKEIKIAAGETVKI